MNPSHSEFVAWMESRPKRDPRQEQIDELRRFLANPRSCYPPEVVADAQQQLNHLLAESN